MHEVSPGPNRSLATAIGSRVSIRLHEIDGGFRDIVGLLTSGNELINNKGESIKFSEGEIAIWREIRPLPDRAGYGAPFSLRVRELEELSDRTWPATTSITYGKWILRISDGYTMRANSVLPTGAPPYGDPPHSQLLGGLEKSVAEIVEIYKKHSLTPAFTVPLPIYKDLDIYLSQNGWNIKVSAHYLVNEIAPNLALEPEKEVSNKFNLIIEDFPSANWLALQSDFPLGPIMQRYPARYALIKSREKVIAVGRIATLNSWSIATRVFVDPAFRGQGIGAQMMCALMSAAARDGAKKISLQVDDENQAALALYKSMGFRLHHSYLHRVLAENTATTSVGEVK